MAPVEDVFMISCPYIEKITARATIVIPAQFQLMVDEFSQFFQNSKSI